MYIEFILLFIDYFRTLKRRNFIFEIIIPFIAGVIICTSLILMKSQINFTDYKSNLVSLIGVLIGFSITAITLLITSNNSNIENLKSKDTEYQIGKNKVSLFDLLIINFSYLIILEVFLIIGVLFLPTLTGLLRLKYLTKTILFSINAFLTIHLLLLNIRNICDLYFILLSKPKK